MATQRRRAGQANAQKALFGGKGKIQNTGNAKVDAKRQTLNDRQAYKRDRANGDKEMTGWALENGTNLHYGGPQYVQTPLGKDKKGNERFGRKTVEDSIKPSGKAKAIPKVTTKEKVPQGIKDRQKELDDLKRMEGYDELKKKKGKRT